MKTLRFLFVVALLRLCTAEIFAQQPFYNIVRYNDRNFSFLRTDTSDHNFFNPIKYIPFNNSGTTFLTLGGEYKGEYRHVTNENWGNIRPDRIDEDGFFWHRFMAHADLRVGTTFRVFAQLKSCLAVDRAGGVRQVIDADTLDLNQLFLEISAPLDSNSKLSLRIGAQEFNYGIARMFSMREGVNVRQSFRALTAKYTSPTWNIDAFVGNTYDSKPGIFDDEPVLDETIWGAYAMGRLPFVPSVGSELYYFGFKKPSSRYASITGMEERHSLGTRLFYRPGNWSFETELVYQFGSFANQTISAYMASGSAGYTFADVLFRPTLSFGWMFSSGDKMPNDGVSNTFNPMYPRPHGSLATSLVSMNVNTFMPMLTLVPIQGMQVQVQSMIWQLNSPNDGLYNPAIIQIWNAPSNGASAMGSQISVFLSYIFNRHVSVLLEATHFPSGEMQKSVATGGKNLQYYSVIVYFRF